MSENEALTRIRGTGLGVNGAGCGRFEGHAIFEPAPSPYASSPFTKIMAMSGRARMAMVALMGR